MNRIEALADAIIASTLYTSPDSEQYQFRNPLGLRAFCPHHSAVNNCEQCRNKPLEVVRRYETGVTSRKYDPATGMRIYDSHVQGYSSGIYDLKTKCAGKSKSKVRKDSSIKELIRSYYLPDGTASYVARFLRKALKDETITENTPIEYFVDVDAREEVTHGHNVEHHTGPN